MRGCREASPARSLAAQPWYLLPQRPPSSASEWTPRPPRRRCPTEGLNARAQEGSGGGSAGTAATEGPPKWRRVFRGGSLSRFGFGGEQGLWTINYRGLLLVYWSMRVDSEIRIGPVRESRGRVRRCIGSENLTVLCLCTLVLRWSCRGGPAPSSERRAQLGVSSVLAIPPRAERTGLLAWEARESQRVVDSCSSGCGGRVRGELGRV